MPSVKEAQQIVDEAQQDVDEFCQPDVRPDTTLRKLSSSMSPSDSPKPVAKPRTSPKPESPKPKPRPREVNDAPNSLDANDAESENRRDSMVMLKRAPSVRDRKKMLEENLRRMQGLNSKHDENKENNKKEIGEVPQQQAPRTEPPPPAQQQETTKGTKRPEAGGDEPVEFRKKNVPLASTKDDNDGTSASRLPPNDINSNIARPTSKLIVRVSKFRHLKGDVEVKAKIENIRNVSQKCAAHCDLLVANPERVAFMLSGPGGKIAVVELRHTGRLASGVIPAIINGIDVQDYTFDPFDNCRIATAGEDGKIRLWNIPEGGLLTQMNEPSECFVAHTDKLLMVKFHPLAKDVITTVAFDRLVRIWDLASPTKPQLEIDCHPDQLFSIQWSPCGRFLATVCRDGKVRVFEPRKSCAKPVVEGGEIAAKKGARVTWVLDGQGLVVTGFTRQSERQIMLFRASDLELLNTIPMDVSPSLLVPFYDEDSSSLFVTGKGDSTVTTFEVSLEFPHFFPLSPYKSNGLHQGLAFLPKKSCNVRNVEFARAYSLVGSVLEPISFKVPRVRKNFFQEDLFPPTRMLWEPTVTAKEWLQGVDREAPRISLKPDDMAALQS